MLIKMEFYQDDESGWWCARGIGVDIFTQGKTLDELVMNVKEAVELHFEDELIGGESIKILTISELDIEVPVPA
ncbi:MAG: type II toxin-antitoxin system HicB family antitoxin [Promethearchaeota archaeon]